MADPANHEVVIVAIPRDDDYVWKISSEKVPHMTLCYLGEFNVTENATLYVQHAASLLGRFGMAVDRRGKLGTQDADVLFFTKSYNFEKLEAFRSQLLADQEIYKAYHAAPQYPQWTPHLTLGYPETPAKPDKRDYPISWVEFDRIAIWTDDSDGPTFQLKSFDSQELEVSMSTADRGAEFLEHFGVKGMKWGVRKKSMSGPPSQDAASAAKAKSIIKTKGVHALSNKELKDLVDRMNLEQQLHKLTPPSRAKKTKMFVSKTLGNVGNQQLNMALNQVASQQVAAALAKASKK